MAKVLSTTLDFTKRYLERHGNRIYVTGILPLEAVLRLLVQDVDFLRDGSRLEIPSDSFFAEGLNFVGGLCGLGDTSLQFGESYCINLPKLGLARDENFALIFSRPAFRVANTDTCIATRTPLVSVS
jgi:hypothetical protein